MKLKKIQEKIKALLYFDNQNPETVLFNGMLDHAKECLDHYKKLQNALEDFPRSDDYYEVEQRDILCSKVIDVFNYCLLWFVYNKISLKDVFKKSLDKLLFKYNQFNS